MTGFRAKRPKNAVDYSPKSTDEYRCDNCRNFRAPNTCARVMGQIAPAGWCKLYSAMPGKDARSYG